MNDSDNVTPIRRTITNTREVFTDGPGLTDLLSRLTGDAKEVAAAEVALQKAKVGEIVGRYRNAAVFFVAAGILALSAFVALLVGLILSLATLIGPGFATLVVTISIFAIAGVLAVIGKNRLTAKAVA